MKKYAFLLVTALLMITLQSCSEEKTEPLKSTSPDGKMNIELWGEKSAAGDPWVVTVKCSAFDDVVTTEVYAGTIDNSNTSFNWTSDTDCTITITQRDGVPVVIPIRVNTVQ